MNDTDKFVILGDYMPSGEEGTGGRRVHGTATSLREAVAKLMKLGGVGVDIYKKIDWSVVEKSS